MNAPDFEITITHATNPFTGVAALVVDVLALNTPHSGERWLFEVDDFTTNEGGPIVALFQALAKYVV